MPSPTLRQAETARRYVAPCGRAAYAPAPPDERVDLLLQAGFAAAERQKTRPARKKARPPGAPLPAP